MRAIIHSFNTYFLSTYLFQALSLFQILLIYFINKIEKDPCPHGICIYVVKGDNELARKNIMSNGTECYENSKTGREDMGCKTRAVCEVH